MTRVKNMSRVESPGTIKPKALQWLRQQAKKSITALAREAGIDPSYLSHIEAERKNPTPAVALRLANALNAPLEMIYDLNPDSSLTLYVLEVPKAANRG